MEPTETRRNGALANRISAPNFYSSCTPRVATKLPDGFLIFCAVAGRKHFFFRERGPPPISGTGWNVKPKFSGYVGTLSIKLPVEGILLPVTTSGFTDNRTFDGGETGGSFPEPPEGPLERDRHPRMRKRIRLVGRRFQPPEGRMRRVIFQKSQAGQHSM